MSELERIIRPFASVPFTPQAPAQPVREVPASTTITIGGSGKISVIQLHHSKHVEINEYIENYETQRTVDKVRIKNEQDDSQYIDMEVMKQVDYYDTISDKNVSLKLSPPPLPSNAELLQSDIVYQSDPKP